MNPHLIKRMFPGASQSLLAANAHDYGPNHPDNPTPSPVAQRPVQSGPLGPEEREEAHPGRVSVRVTSYRRRLIDPDNLAPKYFVDACRYAGLLKDDSAAEVEGYAVSQVKVATKEEERTVISITPANPASR